MFNCCFLPLVSFSLRSCSPRVHGCHGKIDTFSLSFNFDVGQMYQKSDRGVKTITWWSRSGFLLSCPLVVRDDNDMIEKVNIMEIPAAFCFSFVVLFPWFLFLLSFCSVSEDAIAMWLG